MTNIGNRMIIRLMKYDERLDPNSGFYRGWKACHKTILKYLEQDGLDLYAKVIKQELSAAKVFSSYELRSPKYRRSKFKIIKGGKDD